MARVMYYRDEAGWYATVTLRDAQGADQGTRRLGAEGSSCQSLAEPLVLVLALLLEQQAAPELAQTAPQEQGAKATSHERSFGLEARADLVLAEEPGAKLGPQVAGFWRFAPGFGLGLGLMYFPKRRLAEAEPDRGVELSSWALRAALCGVPSAASGLELSLCATQRYELVRSSGYGFTNNRAAQTSAYAVGAGLTGRWRPGSLVYPITELVLEAPLKKPRYASVQGTGAVAKIFDPGPLAAVFALGLGVELP
jgi:hypothetical protein